MSAPRCATGIEIAGAAAVAEAAMGAARTPAEHAAADDLLAITRFAGHRDNRVEAVLLESALDAVKGLWERSKGNPREAVEVESDRLPGVRYTVTLYRGHPVGCTCDDYRRRGARERSDCKHILTVLRHPGEPGPLKCSVGRQKRVKPVLGVVPSQFVGDPFEGL